MNKTIFALSLLICLFSLIFPNRVGAATLFYDNFELGAGNWTPQIGNWIVKDGKYGSLASNPSQNAESLANYDITTPDYNIELDMYPIQGIDRTIRFRHDQNIPGGAYDIHFTNNGISTNFGQSSGYVLVNHPYSENYSYHIKVILKGQNFKFFIDNALIFDKTDSNYIFDGHEEFGLVVATGSVPTEVYFDNINIYTDDQQGLLVPLLKQTDPSWGNDIYDSANIWSSGGQAMSDWGCAVTSAAMVFQYNGLTKMQNNSDLDPGSLNSWLKGQPDGYIRNGLVNWLALSRLSNHVSSINGVSFDALEYSRHGEDNSFLTQNLEDSKPAILAEPGHFVVAKGVDVDNSSFFINDPYYPIDNLSDPKYANGYSSMGIYTPVNSDLSYMMFVVDPSVDVDLLDQNNNSVGDSSIENSINDPNNNSTNSEGAVKIIYLPKPNSGDYKLNVSAQNASTYTLDEYFYDSSGNVKKVSYNGNLADDDEDSYTINFDKDDSNNSSSQIVVPITFDSIREKIKDGYHDKKIKLGTEIVLLVELEIAEKAKKAKISKAALDLMTLLIQRDRRIDNNLAQELISDITTLKNSI